MTPDKFTTWLQGYVAGIEKNPTKEQWDVLKDKLQEACGFDKEVEKLFKTIDCSTPWLLDNLYVTDSGTIEYRECKHPGIDTCELCG